MPRCTNDLRTATQCHTQSTTTRRSGLKRAIIICHLHPPSEQNKSEGLLVKLGGEERSRNLIVIERHLPTSVLAETTDVAEPARSLTRRERRRLDARCVWLAAMVDGDNVGGSWKDEMVMKVLESGFGCSNGRSSAAWCGCFGLLYCKASRLLNAL
jgi:hypothetical protein